MRIPKGIEQVPSTLTTRKLENRTLKPRFCRIRENLRAATLDASSLKAKLIEKFTSVHILLSVMMMGKVH